MKGERRYENLSLLEKTITIKTLIRDYPEISNRQAEFYVSHKDKESSYTLKDFQKFIGSSYETSRYSMDNLVKLGFYDKIKVGKKYVYQPTKEK